MVLSAARLSSPDSQVASQKFNVVFNPATSRLRVEDEPGHSVGIIVIDQPTILTFGIQALDLTFNESPIEWLLGKFDYQLSVDKKTLTLLVGPPPSPFQPVAFNLVADLVNPQAFGLRTSNLFLTPSASLPLNLSAALGYDPSSGSFSYSGWPLQAGEWIVFLHQGEGDITLNISLVSESTGASISFSNPPIVWLRPDGAPPSWIHVNRQSGQLIQIINQFPAGIGLAAPFRFVLEVNGVQVESPDPILVNTTIGDG